MDWSSIGIFVAAALSFAALNLGALKWLLDRHDLASQEGRNKLDGVQRELYELKAELPKEYVRREDWIRFGGALDAKMDRMNDKITLACNSLETLKVQIHA